MENDYYKHPPSSRPHVSIFNVFYVSCLQRHEDELIQVFFNRQRAALINQLSGPVFPVSGYNWGNRDTCWALSATAGRAGNGPGGSFFMTRLIFRADYFFIFFFKKQDFKYHHQSASGCIKNSATSPICQQWIHGTHQQWRHMNFIFSAIRDEVRKAQSKQDHVGKESSHFHLLSSELGFNKLCLKINPRGWTSSRSRLRMLSSQHSRQKSDATDAFAPSCSSCFRLLAFSGGPGGELWMRLMHRCYPRKKKSMCSAAR